MEHMIKNLSLSAIALKVLNQKEDDHLRKTAEIELKKRFRWTGIIYDDFMQRENAVALKRGYNEHNYLFSPTVTMQQLMEFYFKYICSYETFYHGFPLDTRPHPVSFDVNEKEDRFGGATILFSEIHLCNQEYKLQPFFEKIVLEEIENLRKRYYSGPNSEKLLSAVRNELILRLHSQKLVRFDDNDATDIVMDDLCDTYEMFELFDERFRDKYLDRWNSNNLTHYEKAKVIVRGVIDTFCQGTDVIPYAWIHYLCMKDASKLKLQRAKLMEEAKEGVTVDYTKIELPKQLIR